MKSVSIFFENLSVQIPKRNILKSRKDKVKHHDKKEDINEEKLSIVNKTQFTKIKSKILYLNVQYSISL